MHRFDCHTQARKRLQSFVFFRSAIEIAGGFCLSHAANSSLPFTMQTHPLHLLWCPSCPARAHWLWQYTLLGSCMIVQGTYIMKSCTWGPDNSRTFEQRLDEDCSAAYINGQTTLLRSMPTQMSNCVTRQVPRTPEWVHSGKRWS